MKIKSLIVGLTAALAVLQLVLVFTSWLLSAMMVDGVRSLLSSEGLRWFFGGFTTMLAKPWLVYLLLIAMAYGALWRSRLFRKPETYRDRTALHVVLIVLALYVGIIALLAAIPHAILLSATGRLMHSPFSRALIPIVAFGLLLLSCVYGWLSGRFQSLADIADALCMGIARCAPLFLLYIFAVQLLQSLRFVFF